MSPVFVKEFKDSNPCLQCNQKAKGGRAMCSTHLTVAKDAWIIWSDRRRKSGFCIDCEKKSVLSPTKKITSRCKTHRARNVARCNAFTRRNPDRNETYDTVRKEKFLRQGLCHNCTEHNPLDGDYVHCEPCRRFKTLERKGETNTLEFKTLLARRRNARQQKHLNRLEEAKQRLANLGYKVPRRRSDTWAAKVVRAA